MEKTVKVNLHGHVLPGFDRWWREWYGIGGKNLSGALLDRCFEEGLDVYAITDDRFGNREGISRFRQIYAEACKLPGPYDVQQLGDNTFAIFSKEGGTYFIEGQSLDVAEKGRHFELLTFGRSGFPDFNSFDEAINRLRGDGLLAIAEHPLAEGHYGAMGEELERLCAEGKLDAIEHNAKLAVPNWLCWLPKFRGFTRNKNDAAIAIANKYGIPVIANDDSDTLGQIGKAYTLFPRNALDFRSGEGLIYSLNSAITQKNFEIFPGHDDFSEWLNYVWKISVKDKLRRSQH